jgi:hypothetical protein
MHRTIRISCTVQIRIQSYREDHTARSIARQIGAKWFVPFQIVPIVLKKTVAFCLNAPQVALQEALSTIFELRLSVHGSGGVKICGPLLPCVIIIAILWPLVGVKSVRT